LADDPGALAGDAAFAADGDADEALDGVAPRGVDALPPEGALLEDAAADGVPGVEDDADEALALELAPAIGGCEGVGAGDFTSVALRSSVACGRFAAELSVRPASFAGSGLSVMGAWSPGA
jgi:hypothetical protein